MTAYVSKSGGGRFFHLFGRQRYEFVRMRFKCLRGRKDKYVLVRSDNCANVSSPSSCTLSALANVSNVRFALQDNAACVAHTFILRHLYKGQVPLLRASSTVSCSSPMPLTRETPVQLRYSRTRSDLEISAIPGSLNLL